MGKSGAKKKKPAAAAAAAKSPLAAPAADQKALPTPSPPPPPPPQANGPAPHQVDPAVLLRRAHELKEEGNRLFQSRDYSGALRQYELALRLAPRGHPDSAVFHSNRAACLLQLRPVDHKAVTEECSLALQAEPRFPRALLRRARALEALGRHELALADALALLALDADNRDAVDLVHRLRSRISSSSSSTSPSAASTAEPTSRPSPAALGASAVVAGLGPSLPARPFPKKQSPPPPPPGPHQPAPAMSKVNPPPSPMLVPLSNSSQSFAKASAAGSFQKGVLTLPVPSSLPLTATALTDRNVATRWRPLKLVYDHDIRLGQMPEKCTFRTLREVVAKRFPSSKAVLIKYKDADGDLVTITSSAELRLAESCIDKLANEVIKDNKEGDNTLPVLRLHIVEVNPEQEPQLPTEEEKLVEDEELFVKGEDNSSHTSAEVTGAEVTKQDVEDRVGEQSTLTGKKDCGHAECKEAEIDDWLLQFAELFRNQVGIDADAHLDLHELGMELCSEALEETVTSEEAQALFEMAAAKFQEVAALALFNWGNVHMCAARKRIPLDESAPKDVVAAQLRIAYDWVQERYALAGNKYEEALKIKPDFYEGLLALGQQHFETAKLHWSFALADKVDLSTWDFSETFKLFDSAEQKMRAATEMWEKVEEQRMLELKEPGGTETAEVLKKKRKQHSADGQGELTPEEAAEQAAVMRQQIHLFWGNMLFERSQVEFKLSVGNWKNNLDESVERFRLAGASESDISTVLKNHFSNSVSECEEKKVMTSDTEISQTSESIEDVCG